MRVSGELKREDQITYRAEFRAGILGVHPGNHAVFLEESQEPEGRHRRAPVPQSCQASDAHPERHA